MRSYESKNKLLTGFLCAIPASLIGGIGGAITSIAFGIFGAHREESRAAYMQSDAYKTLHDPTYAITKAKGNAINNRNALIKSGEEYACMTNDECRKYFEKIREDYPMSYSCDDGKVGVFNPKSYIECFSTKETKIKESGEEFLFRSCGKLPQDLVRMLDDAKRRGEEIGWLEINYEKYSSGMPKYNISSYYSHQKEYYYRLGSDHIIYYHPNFK